MREIVDHLFGPIVAFQVQMMLAMAMALIEGDDFFSNSNDVFVVNSPSPAANDGNRTM